MNSASQRNTRVSSGIEEEHGATVSVASVGSYSERRMFGMYVRWTYHEKQFKGVVMLDVFYILHHTELGSPMIIEHTLRQLTTVACLRRCLRFSIRIGGERPMR